MVACLLLLGPSKVHAGQMPTLADSALGAPAIYPCNPSGRQIAILPSGNAVVTRAYAGGLAATTYTWDSSEGTWAPPADTSTSSAIEFSVAASTDPEVPANSRTWAIDAGSSNVYVAENLTLRKGTLLSGRYEFDVGSPFDVDAHPETQSAFRQSVYVEGSRVWVLYVYRNASNGYDLKLAWSPTIAMAWQRVTLATNVQVATSGGALFAWSDPSWDSTVGVLWRDSSGDLRFTTANSSGETHLRNTFSGTGELTVPSAVSRGSIAYAVFDDAVSGLTYAEFSVSNSVLNWSRTAISGSVLRDASCPNATPASISYVGGVNGFEGFPVIVYAAPNSTSLRLRAKYDGQLSTEVAFATGDPSSPTAPPNIAAGSYQDKTFLAYASTSGTGVDSFVHAIRGPIRIMPWTRSTAVISPNADGVLDSVTTTASPGRPVQSQTGTVLNPLGQQVAQENCTQDQSTWKVSCLWAPSATPVLTDGMYSVRIDTVEQAPFPWPRKVSIPVEVDLTAPINSSLSLTSSGGSSSWTNDSSVTASFSAVDPNHSFAVRRAKLSNDGGPFQDLSGITWAGNSGTTQWSLSAGEGTKSVCARLGDLAGNFASQVCQTITKDTTPPTGTLTLDSSQGFVRDQVTAHMTWDDPDGLGPASGVEKIALACDGNLAGAQPKDPVDATEVCNLPTPDGPRPIVYEVRDRSGNKSTPPITESVTRDTTPPVVQIVAPNGSPTEEFTVNWSAVDAGSGVDGYRVEIKRDDETSYAAPTDLSGWTSATSYTFRNGIDPHSYTFRVRARDRLAAVMDDSVGVSDWKYHTVTVDYPDIATDNLVSRENICSAYYFATNMLLPHEVNRLVDLCNLPPVNLTICVPEPLPLPPNIDIDDELLGIHVHIHFIRCQNSSFGATPKIVVLSSGVQCDVLPPGKAEAVENCDLFLHNNAPSPRDPIGYGTWSVSALLQKVGVGTEIEVMDVFGSNNAVDSGKLASALESVAGGDCDVCTILLGFPPSDVLDPTSWAMNQKVDASLGKDPTTQVGSLWDVVNEAVTTHPYKDEDGNLVIGLPLDSGLRAKFFPNLETRQANAVNQFSSYAATWARIRSAIKSLSDAGVPIIAGAGELPCAAPSEGEAVACGGETATTWAVPTQSIVGVAALPEVITVGSSYLDTDGVDRLSPVSARGPAPDQTLKPDLVAESGSIIGIVDPASILGSRLADSFLPNPLGWTWPSNAPEYAKVNSGWTIPAAAVVAANAAYLQQQILGHWQVLQPSPGWIRGVLVTLASKHHAASPDGVISAPWDEGAGVLRASIPGEVPSGPAVPDFNGLLDIPVPSGGFDLGGVGVGASKSKDVSFWGAGPAPASPSLPTTVRFLGPNDGGEAVDANYSGDADVSVSTPGSHTVRLAADSGQGGGDRFQGGIYCFRISSGIYGWPACVQRLRQLDLQSSYLVVDQDASKDGERTEDETFILTPGLPVEVGPLGKAFKFIQLDPVFVPLGVERTDTEGKVRFDNVPASFYRVVHFGSYDIPGTYSDLEDPARLATEQRAHFLNDTWALTPESDPDEPLRWTDTRKRKHPSLGPATRFPPARYAAASAYHVLNRQLIVFGGRTQTGVTSDLWKWEKTLDAETGNARENWTQIPRGSALSWPSARFGAASTYDSVRNRVVVFGGTDSQGRLLNDMWSWNGASWTQLFPPPLNPSAPGPTPRTGASMAFDALNDRLVVFGGETASGTGTAVSDSTTWNWNPVTGAWSSISAGPSARVGHGMAYDPVRARIVMFGGRDAAGLLNDTWEYVGAGTGAWLPFASATSPKPSKGQAVLTYVPAGGPGGPGVVSFEYSRGYLQLWTFDGINWARKDLNTSIALPSTAPPASRVYPTFAYDADTNEVVLFGGLAPKVRTLGLNPGAMSSSALLPARTVCVGGDPEPNLNGPLGDEHGDLLRGTDRNPSTCVDRGRLIQQWGGQVNRAAGIREAGMSTCHLDITDKNREEDAEPTVTEVFCEAETRYAVPLSVTTRYVDLIKAADWDTCEVPLPNSAIGINEILGQRESEGCDPQHTQTRWTYSNTGPDCDPDATDGNKSASYSYTSTESLTSPDMVVSILHYRFTIPSPNWYARLRLNLSFDSQNVAITALATTGEGALQSPAAAAVIVPNEPQVRIENGKISLANARDTTTVDMMLWPDGETKGDLYLVLTPMTWVAGAPPGLNAAKVEICKPSIELDTYVKSRVHWDGEEGGIQVRMDPQQDLFTRQLPLASGSAKSWMRHAWNPNAPGGAAWVPFAAEREVVQADHHVPRDWDPSVRRNAGSLTHSVGLHPTDLVYDVNEKLTVGAFLKAPLPMDVKSVDDLKAFVDDASLWAPWSVNGRFFGVAHVADARLRAEPSFFIGVGRSDSPPHWNYQHLPWTGQDEHEDSGWTHPYTPAENTRFPLAFFENYAVPATQGVSAIGLKLDLDAAQKRLYASVSPPVGPSVVVDVDLDCVTQSGGTCPS